MTHSSWSSGSRKNPPKGIKIYNHNDNVLFFTEALTGVIYELTLSFLATIGADGIKGEALQAKTAGITSYNITEANPRLKQFHMDIALHGDYLYFTDLKEHGLTICLDPQKIFFVRIKSDFTFPISWWVIILFLFPLGFWPKLKL